MKNCLVETKQSFKKLDIRLKNTESFFCNKILETSCKFDELNQIISQNKMKAFDDLSKLEKLVCENQKEFCELWDEVDCCVKFNKTSKLNFDNIFETLKIMKIDSEKNSKETKKLSEENEFRRKEIKIFYDKLEFLNYRKANLDEMIERMEKLSLEKADKTELEKRAFTKRCEQNRQENSQAILEAFEKIVNHETFIKSKLNELQSIIDEKITKIESKENMKILEKRLKLINETLLKITNFKNNTEASITTSEYHKDLTCISCSKSVMMKRYEKTTSIPRMGFLLKNHKEKLIRTGGDFRDQNIVLNYPTAEVKYVEGNDGVLYQADST